MVSNETWVKWEYLFVGALLEKGWFAISSIEGRGTAEMRSQWEGQSVAKFADWLGEQGWELVGYSTVTSGPPGNLCLAYLAFKRPRA